MDARDVAAMTADAMNSMEQRIEGSIARLDAKIDGVKHDVHLLSVKVDVGLETVGRQMDEGFRRIIQHIDRR